jgi:hypothetical protein
MRAVDEQFKVENGGWWWTMVVVVVSKWGKQSGV